MKRNGQTNIDRKRQTNNIIVTEEMKVGRAEILYLSTVECISWLS